MHTRLVVATACPMCSAPLDFTEGSNAIQCGYCQSTLLVTGRKQVLSYSIAPQFPLQRAVARVMLAHKEQGAPCRVVKPQLYFLPYYRLTGHDLRWIAPPKNQAALEALPPALRQAILEHPDHHRKSTGVGKPEFRDRYVEKSFLACQLPGMGLHSLGVRPSVLRLNLFHRDELEEEGAIVPLEMTPHEALQYGMKTAARQPMLAREVLGRMLSVIYFPYWVVEVERKGETVLSIADGVSGKVVCREAPCSIYNVLNRSSITAPQVIGLRPLVCPNCGWDLPCRSSDIIFPCSSCDRAWYLTGSDLKAVAYQVARVGATPRSGSTLYLPFWVLEPKAPVSATPAAYVMPAFRYQRLKILVDLARRLTANELVYTWLEGEKPELHSCFYDLEDAIRLGRFIYKGSGQTRRRQDLPAQLDFSRAALVWMPFNRKGREVSDPWTNYHLPHHLLV